MPPLAAFIMNLRSALESWAVEVLLVACAPSVDSAVVKVAFLFFVPSVLLELVMVDGVVLLVSAAGDADAEGDDSCAEAFALNPAVAARATSAENKCEGFFIIFVRG